MASDSDPGAREASLSSVRRIPLLRSLRGRLIVVLTLFVVLTALGLGLANYQVVRGMLRDSVEQQLTLRAQGLGEVLLAHVRQQQERVRLVASRTRLRALLRRHLDGEIEGGPFREETARILRDARDGTRSFREIRLASLDGRVLTATDPALVGQDVAASRAFVQGKERASLGLPTRVPGGFEALLTAPASTNDGRPLGVVLVDIDADPMRRILEAIPSKFASARVRVGVQREEGIRYLFPDTDDEGVVAPEADPAMRAALEGASGFLAVDDFRGRDVLTAHRAVGHGGWGLVTQVDAAEAYASIDELSAMIAVAGLAVAVLGVIVAVRVAARFTRPMLDLAAVAETVGGGDLTARATVASRDEVGVMARSFNAMAERLGRHQSHLEDLVRERTAVLEQRTEQLQRSHRQLAELCRLLEDQAEVMDRDLHRAELIQRSLLPDEPPPLTDFSVQTLYRPGRNIGGDLYDVIKVGERKLVLVVADASGHGVSAAMLAVLFKNRMQVVDEASGEPYRPGVALARLNEAFRRDVIAPGVFFTCAYCLLDTVSRELIVASAGHPPLIWLRQDGRVETIEHTGPALGLYDAASFSEKSIELSEADRVLLYTDGVFDVGEGGPPDVETIADNLRTLAHHRRVLEQILLAVSGGREREDRDDVTMLLLEASGGESHYAKASAGAPQVSEASDGEQLELVVAADEALPQVLTARDADADFLCITGRVTWTFGEVFLEAASRSIESGRLLVIDLAGCDYLDSTMLGTLHEVVRRAAEAGAPVRLQRVPAPLREAFAEISMETVLSQIEGEPLAVPREREPLKIPRTDVRRQRLRLLEAHEELAALSEENRAEFGGVVQALRAELGDDD